MLHSVHWDSRALEEEQWELMEYRETMLKDAIGTVLGKHLQSLDGVALRMQLLLGRSMDD